jgi:hypothetical protein
VHAVRAFGVSSNNRQGNAMRCTQAKRFWTEANKRRAKIRKMVIQTPAPKRD